MKELYVSPELELIRLAAEERLANGNSITDMDDLYSGNGGGEGFGAGVSAADIDIPLY